MIKQIPKLQQYAFKQNFGDDVQALFQLPNTGEIRKLIPRQPLLEVGVSFSKKIKPLILTWGRVVVQLKQPMHSIFKKILSSLLNHSSYLCTRGSTTSPSLYTMSKKQWKSKAFHGCFSWTIIGSHNPLRSSEQMSYKLFRKQKKIKSNEKRQRKIPLSREHKMT